MMSRRLSWLRALAALLLYCTSGGGEQLVDALVFHSHHSQPTGSRVNAGDHCHAEACELGVPITSRTQVAPLDVAGRFAPVTREAIAVAPASPPRPFVTAAPLGSRAPPASS